MDVLISKNFDEFFNSLIKLPKAPLFQRAQSEALIYCIYISFTYVLKLNRTRVRVA